MMKKLIGMLLCVCLIFSLCFTCAVAEEKLVIYTSTNDQLVNLVVSRFMEATGIEVEVIPAGGGELIKRIRTEINNPVADLFWGYTTMSLANEDLFEVYCSDENENLLPLYQNDGTRWYSYFSTVPSVLIVNNNLIGDIPMKGYKDLLNPELRGKIAHADPNAAASSYDHVANMLYAFSPDHNPDDEDGWEYIKAFIDNLDGKALSGSSAVYKGVADGEYTVGLTYESAAALMIEQGAPVSIVYMEEGVVFSGSGMAIVKGANNPEAAKKFINFAQSAEIQDAIGSELTSRAVREGAVMTKLVEEASINVIDAKDPLWGSNHKNEVLERYNEMFVDAME